MLAEEYEQMEAENGTGQSANAKIIYDCLDENSPFWTSAERQNLALMFHDGKWTLTTKFLHVSPLRGFICKIFLRLC